MQSAYLYSIEASIICIILLLFLITLYESEQGSLLALEAFKKDEKINSILNALCYDNNFRSAALSMNATAVKAIIDSNLPAFYKTKIILINKTSSISSGYINENSTVVSATCFISGNSTTFNPTEVIVYVS